MSWSTEVPFCLENHEQGEAILGLRTFARCRAIEEFQERVVDAIRASIGLRPRLGLATLRAEFDERGVRGVGFILLQI